LNNIIKIFKITSLKKRRIRNGRELLVLIQDTNGLFEGFNLEGEEISKVLLAQALSPKR
jgi:hypothetical protein